MDPFEQPLLRSKRIAALPAWLQEAVRRSEDPLAAAEAAQVAHRLIRNYGGPERFQRIIGLFEEGVPIATIAREFRVTKQRVSQWRQCLGHVRETFQPRPVIAKVLKRGDAYDPP